MLKKTVRFEKFSLLLVAGIAMGAFSYSLFAQHSLGYLPCKMCVLQRCIYLLLGIASLLSLPQSQKKEVRICLLSVAAMGTFIATLHFGIQLGIFPDKCINLSRVSDLASFEQILQTQKSCSKVSFTLFKLPLPLINLFAFSLLGILAYFPSNRKAPKLGNSQ